MKYWPLPLLLLGACSGGDKGTTPASPHNPTPYALDVPVGFPIPEIPADNPLTIEGIELDRLLFSRPHPLRRQHGGLRLMPPARIRLC